MELPLTNSFQIKPSLENLPQESRVKQLIQKVVGETLLSKFRRQEKAVEIDWLFVVLDKTYSTDNAKTWTKTIADDVNRVLKDDSKYKHVVQVVISQKLGQGFKFTARCRWDSECDRQITDSFTNDTMICIVTVFTVYLY